MNRCAEQFTVFFQGQHIAERIYARFINLIQAYQMVAYFIGRIAQHQHDFLCAFCNTAQADGKPVAGQDREDDADGLAAQLRFHIRRNVIYGAIVSLRTGHDGFRDGDDVPVTQGKAFACRGFQYAVRYNVCQVIALTDDG